MNLVAPHLLVEAAASENGVQALRVGLGLLQIGFRQKEYRYRCRCRSRCRYRIDRHLGCLKEVSKSVQVLLKGIEAVMVLTVLVLKQRALFRWALQRS